MILHAVIIIILSIAAGFLYTAGGSSKYPFWFREVGVMLCEVISLLSLGIIHWSLILTAGATYGVQTTYFKKKGSDAKLWNWLLVGLAFSISVLPVVIFNHFWVGFFLRTLIVVPYTAIWSEIVDEDWLEEGGRGVIQIVTLPLLLIGG